MRSSSPTAISAPNSTAVRESTTPTAATWVTEPMTSSPATAISRSWAESSDWPMVRRRAGAGAALITCSPSSLAPSGRSRSCGPPGQGCIPVLGGGGSRADGFAGDAQWGARVVVVLLCRLLALGRDDRVGTGPAAPLDRGDERLDQRRVEVGAGAASQLGDAGLVRHGGPVG